MKAVVDSKQLAGIATVVARRGQVVQQMTYGQADAAGGKPMQMDSIVRIYSMTKPITGVAMMMLYEEGKWKPSDPISRHIPEFKDLKVYAGNGPDGQPQFVAPTHAPTMGELMSHTAGFTYGVFGATPVDKLYQQSSPLGAASLQEFIDRMASCRCCISRAKAGCTASASTFRVTWSRSCRASRSPSSCASASSSRSA